MFKEPKVLVWPRLIDADDGEARTFNRVQAPLVRFELDLPTSMPSTLSEHDNTQDASEDSALSSFYLFLNLMTPAEFAHLLRSRVRHLLQTWSTASAPDDTAAYDNIHAQPNKPLPVSMDAMRSFTSFFRMQDTPPSEEPGANPTPPSLNNLQRHLSALETLLSCVSPKELQDLIHSRLKERGMERTAAIRGLLDIMRCAVTDDLIGHENSHSNVNSHPDSKIPRVMSPGTRDQSADADGSITLESRDPQEIHPTSSTVKEYAISTSRHSAPLLSPTVSTSTSRISSSTVTSPIEHSDMQDILESQIISHRKSDSSAKEKESVSQTDVFPYPKLTRLSRRSQTSPTVVPEPPSQPWFNLRTPERPRRKSERLSKRIQSTSRSPEMKEELVSAEIVKPQSPISPSMSKSSSVVPSARVSRLDSSSSFAYGRTNGRESPPAPVLRAVDWSNPVQSSPGSVDDDDEDDDDAMEEDDEELDELADDTSEADSRIPEIVDGWNSHLTDSGLKNVAQSTQGGTSPAPVISATALRETETSEAVFKFPLKSHSPQFGYPNSFTAGGAAKPAEMKVEYELGGPVSLALPQPQVIHAEIPRPHLDASAAAVPETTYPLQSPPFQQPVYPTYYPSSLSHNPYSSSQIPPELRQVSIPHPSQPPPPPPPPHQHNITSSISPPSYHPPPHAHNLNPYPPPPPPPTHYDYHSLPQPPPHHISSYPSQYTSSPWYGNSYFHQPPPPPPPPSSYNAPHPPMSSYTHQHPNIPRPPIQDQHLCSPQVPLPPPQSYTPSNYPPIQQSSLPPPPPPFAHSSQVQYTSPQGQYPQDNHGQYAPHTQSNPYHAPPPFSSPGPPQPHPQPHAPAHPQLQTFTSPPSFIHPHLHPLSLQFPPSDNLPLNITSDSNRSDFLESTNNNSTSAITITIPSPPSPVIPPPSGPRPPPLVMPPRQPRSLSPPVKPPEGPKRFFQGRRNNGGKDVNLYGTKDFDDPNVRYTDDVGIKETAVIRRRCHNCRSVEAPSWRKSKLHVGKILCNKCGIYESTHMVARPLKTRPRRLLLNGERDYLFEMFKSDPSPVTPLSGSPISSLPTTSSTSVKRRKRIKKSPDSYIDDDDDDYVEDDVVDDCSIDA